MIIREMVESDIPQILDIEFSSFLAPWNQNQFMYEMKENPYSYLFVAEQDEMILGFIDFWITFETSCINQIAVVKGLRHKGIGSILLLDALERMKLTGVEIVTLEVRESNIIAQKFYQKMGFKQVTLKQNYYSNGENAVYMERRLKNE